MQSIAEFKISRKGEEDRQLRQSPDARLVLPRRLCGNGWMKIWEPESFKRVSFSPLLHHFPPAPFHSTASVNTQPKWAVLLSYFQMRHSPDFCVTAKTTYITTSSPNVSCAFFQPGIWRILGLFNPIDSHPLGGWGSTRMWEEWVMDLDLKNSVLKQLDEQCFILYEH
jgi:hypothetical protein